jgi:hypothetical protein
VLLEGARIGGSLDLEGATLSGPGSYLHASLGVLKETPPIAHQRTHLAPLYVKGLLWLVFWPGV